MFILLPHPFYDFIKFSCLRYERLNKKESILSSILLMWISQWTVFVVKVHVVLEAECKTACARYILPSRSKHCWSSSNNQLSTAILNNLEVILTLVKMVSLAKIIEI